MESLVDWIRNLILIIIFAGFLQLLIPGNSFHRYIRVVMGFFIIVTLLHPLLNFLQLDFHGEISWPSSSSSFAEIQRVGEEIREKGERELFVQLKGEMERRLQREGFFVHQLYLFMDDNHQLQKVTVYLNPVGEKEDMELEILEHFRRLYQLSDSHIQVKWNQ